MTDSARATEVVVTGIGAVSPFGRGTAALWNGLMGSANALAEFDAFDAAGHRTSIAGQVPGRRGPVTRVSRADRFAIDAAREAWSHAGLATKESTPQADESQSWEDAGVFFGSSAAGMLEGEEYFHQLLERRSVLRVGPLSTQQTNSPGDSVARTLGFCGPVETIASACSAATMAIEAALSCLRAGEADVAIAGGADAICRLTYAGFNALRAVDERPCRPFQVDRDGLSIGEGAGALVLETRAHAESRGATVLAVLSGASSTCDAHHMTAPQPEGEGAARAIRSAIADAGLKPDAIDFINSHGTGTPHNDEAEWNAFRSVFGERAARIPVTATKSALGHSLGACGALEAVASILSLERGVLPPVKVSTTPDPACPVKLVATEALRPERCDVALSTNLAFGGANAAIVLQRATAPTPR